MRIPLFQGSYLLRIFEPEHICFTSVLALSLLSTQALAAEVSIVSSQLEMVFGYVEYQPVNNGSVQLGSNGNGTLTGDATGVYYDNGTTAQASATIGGDPNADVDISCGTTGTLALSGQAITIDNLQITTESNGVAYNSATACQGLATTVLTTNLGAGASVKLYIGGRVTWSSSLSNSGEYSTSNVGGVPITLKVDYTP